MRCLFKLLAFALSALMVANVNAEGSNDCGKNKFYYHYKSKSLDTVQQKIMALSVEEFKSQFKSMKSRVETNLNCELDRGQSFDVQYFLYLKKQQDTLIQYIENNLAADAIYLEHKKGLITHRDTIEKAIGQRCLPENQRQINLPILESRELLDNNNVCDKALILEKYEFLYGELAKAQQEKERELYSEVFTGKRDTDKAKVELDKSIKILNRLGRALDKEEHKFALVSSHDHFSGYYTAFYAGVEFQNVDTLFDKGVPRAGLLVYRKPKEAVFGWASLKPKNWHVFSNFLVSGIGEIAENEEVKEDEEEIEKGIEANLNFFVPYSELDLGQHSLVNGPLLSYGGNKIEEQNRITRRQYIGWRTAIEPEVYTDFLYGKTEDLSSNRAEIRVQMAVPGLNPSTRLFLGAIINIGVHGHEEADEGDTLRVYIKWNSPFSNIFPK